MDATKQAVVVDQVDEKGEKRSLNEVRGVLTERGQSLIDMKVSRQEPHQFYLADESDEPATAGSQSCSLRPFFVSL